VRTIPRKKLTAVYIIHGHGDHFFGLPTRRKRFPGVQTYATRGTLDHMLDQLDPRYSDQMYGSRFPGQIDQQPPPDEVVKVYLPTASWSSKATFCRLLRSGRQTRTTQPCCGYQAYVWLYAVMWSTGTATRCWRSARAPAYAKLGSRASRRSSRSRRTSLYQDTRRRVKWTVPGI
jgi:hypothetical protein